MDIGCGKLSILLVDILLSEYSLAISATASPILFLTVFTLSTAKASSSLCRIAKPDSCGKDRNISVVSLFRSFLFFEAMRLKITDANDRICVVD